MYKRVGIFTLWLRELVFDTKEESNILHHKFNPRKALVFCILLLSLVLNAILMSKCYRLAVMHMESIVTYNELVLEMEDFKGKNKIPAPSDSRTTIIDIQ